MRSEPLDIVSNLIERHVVAEEGALAAINIVSALNVLAGGGTHTPAPAARAAARRRLVDAAAWLNGRPAQVAALVNGIAAMDRPNHERRKAVLSEAWADLLPD